MSERPIDVVLLHHGEEDKATALVDQLRKEGVESRPISELDADEDWPKQLEEALNATSVCAVLLGNDERLADPGTSPPAGQDLVPRSQLRDRGAQTAQPGARNHPRAASRPSRGRRHRLVHP
jgi:histidyl-tRNA synthetase